MRRAPVLALVLAASCARCGAPKSAASAEELLPQRPSGAVVTAALGVSSPQIRNMGTVAGDLCQRPRCWYFRNGHGLFAMKDGKSLVPNGENRYHAIFGGNPAGAALRAIFPGVREPGSGPPAANPFGGP